jgi:hypothetical protein
MSEETKLFFAGIPTRPDVDKLMQLTQQKVEGDLITRSEIEAIVGDAGETRLRTVISAWKRRAFRELNVFLVADPTLGYRLADPKERISCSAGLVTAGRRRIMKAAIVAEATPPNELDENGNKLRDHIRTIPARLKLAQLCAPRKTNLD